MLWSLGMFFYNLAHHNIQFSSVAQSCPALCDPMNRNIPGLPVHHQLQSLLKLMSIESVMPSNHLILCWPLLPASIFSASGSFQISQFFTSGGQSTGVSASASALPMNTQDWFPLGSPCRPRDSQESSPAPQFKSINSLALSLLYGPTLTSVHDYWESHSFGYMDLCWQSDGRDLCS